MNTQKGAAHLLVGIVALVLIGGGAWLLVSNTQQRVTEEGSAAQGVPQEDNASAADSPRDLNEASGTIEEDSPNADPSPAQESSGNIAEMQESELETSFTGTILAGDSSLLIAFNQSDYEKALAAGNRVLLIFYSNWCPTCKAEQQEAITAFNTATDSGTVAFRVNFGDSDTDASEEALAREFGVTARHTKIGIESGERVLKTLERWETAEYQAWLSAN